MPMGILGIVGIVFLILKLTSTIDWSWWWVLAPFWGWVVLVFVLAFLAAVIELPRR